MLWAEMTMPQFEEARRQVNTVILPIGVLEQHGPHLPLGLDAMHAYELAIACAKLHPCLVAPPLYCGITKSTAQHPGTIGISGRVLFDLIVEWGLAFERQGINNLLLLTGHAGSTHQATLVEAGEMLLKKTKLEVAVVCVLDLFGEAGDLIQCQEDSHAGEVETSLAIHLWPDLVRGTAPEEYPTYPKFILVRDKKKHWPGGVWGDPSKASREKGQRLFELEAKALARVLADLEELPRQN
jgi:creatinine amidohydrolase